MKRALCVIAGTRPEVIKLAPVVAELRREAMPYDLLLTGQHAEMLKPLVEHFGLDPVTVLPMERKTGSLSELIGLVALALSQRFLQEPPSGIVVQGDTSSAMIAGICGFSDRIPVFHVEAGLRTQNLYEPFPEEFNRRVISLAATAHFAPSAASKDNLVREGVRQESCHIVGNTCIDALLWTIRQAGNRNQMFGQRTFGILATCHRRESWDRGIEQVCLALKDLTLRIPDAEIVFPVHPNPAVGRIVESVLSGVPHVRLVEPMGYSEFCNTMMDCSLIISDSGGVQEEALAIGKPTLVTRWNTERPEVLCGKTIKLVGPDRVRIVEAAVELRENATAYAEASQAAFPFGHGDSGKKIVQHLREFMRVNGEDE